MPLKKADLKVLRKRLPRGYTSTAVTRLAAKGKTCTPQYVAQQFSSKAQDEMVITILCDIADEHEAKFKELAIRARGGAK